MSKKLLIAFLVLNTFIIVVGILLFIFSCMILSNEEEFHDAVRGSYRVAPVLLVVIGITISTMAVIGIFASIDRKNKYLCGYTIALVFAMILELVAMSFAFYSTSNIRNMIRYQSVHLNNPSLYLDRLQQEKMCCGYVSYKDYVTGSEGHADKIPPSCCPGRPKTCVASHVTHYFKNGCREYILEYHTRMSMACGITTLLCIFISVSLIVIIDKMGRIPVTVKPKKDLSLKKQKEVIAQEKKLEQARKDEEELYI